ncbi:MAG: FtsX-like permease family protein [Desulfobulbaceae bacterium]|nr:FtsX-like permease family protein [Desulfobulbaceae bacterium]
MNRRRRIMRVAPLLWLLLLHTAPFNAAAQNAGSPGPGDPDTLAALKTAVERLTEFDDRSTGSEGSENAAAYIRERLAATGPEQLDSFRFTVPVREHEDSRLIVNDLEIPLAPIYYNSITPESLPPEGLRGKLVYAGRGELADFNGREIKGSIVLMEFESGRNWLNASSLGASALIYINRGTAPKMRFLEKEELSPLQFPCFWIDEQILSRLTGSEAAAPESVDGITVRLKTTVRWKDVQARNIYALYPGTNDELQNELIIVEAFYDSSILVAGRSPGADEALSIAGLLELAEYLSRQPPSRPFLLVASSGHAQNLAGMRETIWTANARSKDLRDIDKVYKADRQERTHFLELLENYQQGLFDDSQTPLLHRAINQALKLQVDSISTDLMRLRMEAEKKDVAGQVQLLARQRFQLRQLGWSSTLSDISPEQQELLHSLVENSIHEHRAVLGEVEDQRQMLTEIKRFRSLFIEFEPRAVISLHLSSHGYGLGAFHQGFLYHPLRPQINRTAAFRDIEAALQEAAQEVSGPEFVSTLRPNRLRPWEDMLPDRPALGGEVSSLAALPGLTLATIGDIRQYWSTPFDTPERINWDYAAGQWQLALHLVAGIDRAESLELGYIRKGFSTVEGNTRLMLHGELFAEQPAPNTMLLAFQGLRKYYLKTDRQGKFLLKGVADKKHIQDKVILEGYRFNEDGTVIWAIDKNLTGKNSYRVKMDRNAMKTDLIMFPCLQTTIFNLLEPRSFKYMTKLQLIDGRREAPPIRFWYSRIDTRKSTIASIYLQPESSLKLTLSDTILKKKLILTNGDNENPQGRGYDIAQYPALHNTVYRAAGDMWTLLRPRISNLEKHGIHNNRIKSLLAEGEQALANAEEALGDFRYDVFSEQSSRSWALASRVYDHVESTQKDVLFGVLFYIALFVPFAFCLERVLFGFVTIYKRIAGFTGILLLLILIISQVHPAFGLAYSPTVVILAFFIIGLSFLVTMIITMRFEEEMILLQRRTSHKRPVEISKWKAFVAAFFLGVSNLRRRRLRTFLTCLTLIILTFTIMSFTTVKSMTRQNRLLFNNTAPYHGLLLKNIGWSDLPVESLTVFNSLFHGTAEIAPRVWLQADPPLRAMRIEAGFQGQAHIMQAISGLGASEPAVSGLDRILLEGRWFNPGEKRAVIIPSQLAARLNIDPATPERNYLDLWGIQLQIIGVFSEKLLQENPDLDGEIITPAIFPSESMMEISEVEQEALESGEDVRSFQGRYRHLSPEQVLLVPASTLLEMNGKLKGVAVTPRNDGVISISEVEALTDRFNLTLFSGEPEGVFLYNASETMSYAGMPNIIIPLMISILIVLNTMISSVYERKREIAVYTSIGLAPTHVSFLFIAEAIAFAILSVVLGYVLAQTSAGLLAETRLWSGITVNYSSTAGIAAMLLVMAVVLLSVIYPSRVASNIAIPDVNRSWVMPEIKKDSMEITLPFLMRYHENLSITGFLYSYFKGHQDISHGIFSTGPVEVFKIDDPAGGLRLPMATQCVHLRSKIWLAPFDFGIMQWVDIHFCPAQEGPEFLEIRIVMQRMAGEVGLWQRVNKSFLNALRKQLLVWRSLDAEGQRIYAELLPEPKILQGTGEHEAS